MYELLVGKAPFSPPKGIKNQKMINKILEKNIMSRKPNFPPFVGDQAKDLVIACL